MMHRVLYVFFTLVLLSGCSDGTERRLQLEELERCRHADWGEMPQALNAYNDAADRADTTATDCDYRTLSRVHAQTAQLYYSQLLPDNMLRHNRLAIHLLFVYSIFHSF